MESFLEPTRSVPEPTPIENYLFGPAVPEVSMINITKTDVNNFYSEEDFNKIKRFEALDPDGVRSESREKCIPLEHKSLQAHFAKKQVRFESLKSLQDISQKPLSCKTVGSYNCTVASNYQNFNAMRKNNNIPLNQPRPFEEIYMANIPDRKLDLSLIDLPNTKPIATEKSLVNNNKTEVESAGLVVDNNELSRDNKKTEIECEKTYKYVENVGLVVDKNELSRDMENKENKMPKTYQDFLELQKKITSKRQTHNDSVTDIFNYKRNLNCNLPENNQGNTKLSQLEKLKIVKSNPQKNDDVLFDVGNQNQLQSQAPLPPYSNLQYEPVKLWQSCNHPYNNQTNIKQKCDIETQTYPYDLVDDRALESRKYSEPNTSDLLKIIAQQNEQLLILQKQVSMLLERDKHSNLIEPSLEDRKISDLKANPISSPKKNRFRQENTITKQSSIYQDNQRKWGMSKFSINLTTSFDMPLRTQQKQNFVNNEPQIQEITETDFSPKNDHLEQSIHLQEPVNVREQCPSPQPSININMNDYESSDEEQSEIGVTFYNNLMGQVNNILKKAQFKTEDLKKRSQDEIKDKTLDKVREATLKHLKSIGINVDDRDNCVTPTNNKNYSPSEISLTVQQLLMKYLPPDQAEKQKKSSIESEITEGILKVRPEFSLASLEYMKKYNLITSKEKVPDIINSRELRQKETNNLGENKRILDLTALKMQPKLL